MHSVLQLPFCVGPHSQLSWGVQAADWTKLLVFAFTLLDNIRDEDYSRLLWFPSKENHQRLLEKSIRKTQIRRGARRGKAPPWRQQKKELGVVAHSRDLQAEIAAWVWSQPELQVGGREGRKGRREGGKGGREGREGRDRRQGTETRREGVSLPLESSWSHWANSLGPCPHLRTKQERINFV